MIFYIDCLYTTNSEDMKKILSLTILTYILFVLSSCGISRYSSSDTLYNDSVHTLLQRSGVYYLPNSDMPYTGNYFNKNTGEFKQLKDGVSDGLFITFYDDGTKKSLETIRNGKLNGTKISWYFSEDKSW